MPRLLLVVGLLGTFLGLGLAANHASNIFNQYNSIDTMSSARIMNKLMMLLNGLETNFKAAIWGASGFVILKIWNELTRFDEKRLEWVINKIKLEAVTRQHMTCKTHQIPQTPLSASTL